ncbi:MAG TPA: bacteriohemerythrin [Desulfuromonadaceae bacterium]
MGIQWRDSLAIGVEEIDDQHKELLRRFNGLLSACEAGKGIEELKPLLTFLDDYVIEHFSNEERLQRTYGYPGYATHKREHDSFIERVLALKGEIDSEGVAVHHVMETNNMLLKWLLNHISKVDTELGKFLRASGT